MSDDTNPVNEPGNGEAEALQAIANQNRELDEKKALFKKKEEDLNKREEDLSAYKQTRAEKKATLVNMEKALQIKCKEFDECSTKIEKELDERQRKLDEKVGCFTSAERFMKTQELLNEVYTLFILGGGAPEDLYESLKLILEARAKF